MGRLSYLYVAISLSIASAVASEGSDSYPFAPLPLSVDQNIKNGAKPSKPITPNILFLLDDTSSMRSGYKPKSWNSPADPDADDTSWLTRTFFLKQAMNEIASDPAFKNANYYVMDMCGTTLQAPVVGQPLSYTQLGNAANRLKPNVQCGGQSDHFVTSFYEALYFLRKNMNEAQDQYRCTPNALIFVTDTNTNQTKIKWNDKGVAEAYGSNSYNPGWNGENATTYWFKQAAQSGTGRGGSLPAQYWDCPGREMWDDNSTLDMGDHYLLMPADSAYDNPQNEQSRPTIFKAYKTWYRPMTEFYKAHGFRAGAWGCRFVYAPDWDKYANFGSRKTFNSGTGSSDVLGDAAQYVYKHPMVDANTAARATDASGQPWNAPKDPTKPHDGSNVFPRNIVTFGIGFNGANSTNFSFLNSASTGFGGNVRGVDSTEGIVSALKEAMKQIEVRGETQIAGAYSYTSPATLGSKRLDGGIGVYLNEGLTESSLRFFPYLNNQFVEKLVSVPSYPYSDKDKNKLFIAWQRPSEYIKITDDLNVLNFDEPKVFDLVNSSEQLISYINSSVDTEIKASSVFGADNDTQLRQLIPWIARSESDKAIGSDFRERKYPLGDVVDSPVIPGGKIISSTVDCTDKDKYGKPIGSAKTCTLNLQKYLVTSANDGMTYIFKRTLGQSYPYTLSYRYLPIQMNRTSNNQEGDIIGSWLYKISRKDYAQPGGMPHLWLNNGGITMRTVELRKDGPSRTFMVGSPGQGGRGLFALNIGGKDVFAKDVDCDCSSVGVDKKNLTAADVYLFETPKGWYNDSGYIIGNPSIARLSLCRNQNKPASIVPVISKVADYKTKPWSEASVLCSTNPSVEGSGVDEGVIYTAIYGSGFNMPTVNYGNKLKEYTRNVYTALNIRQIFDRDYGKKSKGTDVIGKKGMLIRKISIPDNRSGLGMPAVVDMDFDGVADLAYAVTYDGHLYRFDLRGNSPSEWHAVEIFNTPTVKRQILTTDKKGEAIVRDDGTEKQHVISSPNVYRYVKNGKIRFIVTFGTGSNLYPDDLYDRTVQSIYSIEDRPEEEANPVVPKVSGNGSNSQTYLVQRTLKSTDKERSVQILTKSEDDNNRGWYTNLDSLDSNNQASGERIVYTPIVLYGTSIYSSVIYIPNKTNGNNDICNVVKVSGTSTDGWVMAFQAKTGDATLDSGNASFRGFSEQQVGIKQEHGATGLSEFIPVVEQGKEQLATNLYGLLGNGKDTWDKLNNKECVTQDVADNAKLIGQNKKGLNDNIGLVLPICPEPSGLLRLNYRRIDL